MHTPLGGLSEIQQYLPTSFSWGYVKHYLETPADLPAFRSYIERLEFSPAYAEAERRKAIIGDNGVVLVYAPRSPFMEMVTNYAGIVPLVYLLNDAPDEMAELLALMEGKHDIAAEMAANSPADCVMIPENLSSEVVGARYYKLFLRPYERKWIERIRQNGKYSFIHLDGTLKGLIGLVSETGFDVIEAVTPLPCGDISMAQAMESVRPETILWGGLPGVIFTPLFPEPDFEQHVIAMLNLMKRRPNYVLGVGDQVPPDGLLERVARVASLCATHGQYASVTALG
jgi:uroporphyrinogen-III decarboxylase